jgi:hypothetical protein
VKRPEQHVTDSEADGVFQGVFADWSVNGSKRDYGWDYVVEVFRNGESTGFLFNGQLKGSRHTEYSADGSFISQELEIDSADYLARQLRQPTFLFHADVAAKKLFWSAIQLDQRVLDVLEQGNAKSLTVRIPTANVLPERFERFLQDLTQSQMVVVSRILLGTRPVEFADAMASQPIGRISEVAEGLHEKGFHLELQAAFLRRKGGDIVGAIAAIRKVADTAGASGYPKRVIVEAVEESDRLPECHKERFRTQLTDYMFRMDAPYVACFCENADLLSQWRGYGASGEGFAVGFGVPWLLSLNKIGFRLQQVIYDPGQQRAMVTKFLDRVAVIISEAKCSDEENRNIWQMAAASLSSWAVMFKHPSFREEREWRIISEVEKRTSYLKTLFRRSGRRIVPYVTICIPHDAGMEDVSGTAITRVVRGPYFRGIDVRGLYFMLVARGFITAGGRVEDSIIPLC